MSVHIRFFYLLLSLFLATYFYGLSQVAFKTDMSILTSFAERMLSGAKMSDAYYEVNPPLSMIIFIPEIWIKNLLGIPVYYAHYIYLLFLISLSTALCYGVLRRFSFIDTPTRQYIGIIYFSGLFIVPNFSFGDREHFIALGLAPFLLVQTAITLRISIPAFAKISSLILGTAVILIKPHYGIIPVAAILHRMWKEKRLLICLDADFLFLAAGTIIYAIILVTFFPDFLGIILPDVITFYVGLRENFVYLEVLIYVIFMSAFCSAVSTFSITSLDKKIISWLFAVTLLLFVPYLVQAKGFDYHRIPWLFSLYLLLGYIFYALLRTKLREDLTRILAVLCLLGITVFIRPFPLQALTHDKYKALPLSIALEKHCDKPCSFLLLNDTADLIHQLAIYHNAIHASRFSSMWYLYLLIKDENLKERGEPRLFNDEEYKKFFDKYTAMVVEDFKKYNPDIVIVLKTLNIGDLDFDFLTFYEKNMDFKVIFSEYREIETLKFNRDVYTKGFNTLYDSEDKAVYKIYKKKKT